MDKVEKIKIEIERKRNAIDYIGMPTCAEYNRVWAYNDVLEIIDSLEEESVSEELEQEIDKYVNIPDNQGLPDLRRELSDCARHFANWQKEQMEKEYSDLNKGLVSAKGVAVYMAYETGKKEVIAKACKYLQEHREEVETEDNGISGWISDEFIEKFKKYMNG